MDSIPSSTGWRSYDSVAEAYERAAVPRFLQLARDLVAVAAPSSAGPFLDVGTGTGLVARILRASFGPECLVVGLDPSFGMLRRARVHGSQLAAGMLPRLPFRDSTFDIVTANLVLSHLVDYEAGATEAVRVLGVGGRLGCTAFGPEIPTGAEDEAEQADAIVEAIARDHGLDMTPPTPAVPSQESLRDREHLDAVLRGAGLVATRIEARTYDWRSSIDEYFLGRAWPPRCRYIRQQANSRMWEAVQNHAVTEVRRRFGDEIRSRAAFWIAVGTKP